MVSKHILLYNLTKKKRIPLAHRHNAHLHMECDDEKDDWDSSVFPMRNRVKISINNNANLTNNCSFELIELYTIG